MSAVTVKEEINYAENVVIPQNAKAFDCKDELEIAIFRSMRAITGDEAPLYEPCVVLKQKLSKIPLICARRALRRGVAKYNNKYHKYPKEAFWGEMISDVMRDERMKEGTFDDKYERPSAEESMEVVQMAREMAEKFDAHKTADPEKGGGFTRKCARYREYAKQDLVGVNSPDTEWVPRSHAEAKGLEYIDPAVWLESKGKIGKAK